MQNDLAKISAAQAPIDRFGFAYADNAITSRRIRPSSRECVMQGLRTPPDATEGWPRALLLRTALASARGAQTCPSRAQEHAGVQLVKAKQRAEDEAEADASGSGILHGHDC